jgi:hypothetical protein
MTYTEDCYVTAESVNSPDTTLTSYPSVFPASIKIIKISVLHE